MSGADEPRDVGSEIGAIMDLMAGERFVDAIARCDELLSALPLAAGPPMLATFIAFGWRGEAAHLLGDRDSQAQTAFELMTAAFENLGVAERGMSEAERGLRASYGKWTWQFADNLLRNGSIDDARTRAVEVCMTLRASGEQGYAVEAVHTHAAAMAQSGDDSERRCLELVDRATDLLDAGSSADAIALLGEAETLLAGVEDPVIRAELEFAVGVEMQRPDGFEERALSHLRAASGLVPGTFMDGLASVTAGGLLGFLRHMDQAVQMYAHAEEVLRDFKDDALYTEAAGRLRDAMAKMSVSEPRAEVSAEAPPPRVRAEQAGARIIEIEQLMLEDRAFHALAIAEQLIGDLRRGMGGDGTRFDGVMLDLLGRALFFAGQCHHMLGQADRGLERLSEALQIYETLGDPQGMANCWHAMSRVRELRGELEDATGLLLLARSAYELIEDEQGLANSAYALGELAWRQDDRTAAERQFREAIEAYRRAGDPLGEGNALHSLAELIRHADDFEEATRLFAAADDAYQAAGNPRGRAHCRLGLARLAYGRDDLDEAEQLFREAQATYRTLADPQGDASCLRSLAAIRTSRGDDHGAERLYREAIESFRRVPDPQGTANTLIGLGDLLQARGAVEAADAAYAEAEELYRQSHDSAEAWALLFRAALGVDRDPGSALKQMSRAIEVVEQVRMSLDAAFARQEHSVRWQQIYRIAILAARSAEDGGEALRFVTLFAGRLLYEQQLRPVAIQREQLTFEQLAESERIANAIGQAERLLSNGGLEGERDEARRQLQAQLAERARMQRLVELQAPLEPPPPVDVTALRAELARRRATLLFLLWQRDLHSALVVRPDGTIRFVDYEDATVQQVERVLADLRTETEQQVRAADFIWRGRILNPLRELIWDPLQELVGEGGVYLVSDPVLAQLPVRAWSPSVRLLPTPGALLAQVTADATSGSIFAVGGAVLGDLRGPAIDLALVQRARGVTVAGDQLAALLGQRGVFELALATGHMSRSGIAFPRTVPDPGTGLPVEISVTATLRELLGLQLKLRWAVLSGCWSGATDGSPDLLSIGGIFMQATGAEAVVVALWPVGDLAATLLWAGILHHTRDGHHLEAALAASLAEVRALRTPEDWASYLDVLRSRHPDVPALVEFASDHVKLSSHRLPLSQLDLDAWAIFHR